MRKKGSNRKLHHRFSRVECPSVTSKIRRCSRIWGNRAGLLETRKMTSSHATTTTKNLEAAGRQSTVSRMWRPQTVRISSSRPSRTAWRVRCRGKPAKKAQQGTPISTRGTKLSSTVSIRRTRKIRLIMCWYPISSGVVTTSRACLESRMLVRRGSELTHSMMASSAVGKTLLIWSLARIKSKPAAFSSAKDLKFSVLVMTQWWLEMNIMTSLISSCSVKRLVWMQLRTTSRMLCNRLPWKMKRVIIRNSPLIWTMSRTKIISKHRILTSLMKRRFLRSHRKSHWTTKATCASITWSCSHTRTIVFLLPMFGAITASSTPWAPSRQSWRAALIARTWSLQLRSVPCAKPLALPQYGRTRVRLVDRGVLSRKRSFRSVSTQRKTSTRNLVNRSASGAPMWCSNRTRSRTRTLIRSET